MVETDEKTGCAAFPHRLYPATMKTAQALQRMWSHAVKKLGILKGHVSCFLLHLALSFLPLLPSCIPPLSNSLLLPDDCCGTSSGFVLFSAWMKFDFSDLSVASNCINLCQLELQQLPVCSTQAILALWLVSCQRFCWAVYFGYVESTCHFSIWALDRFKQIPTAVF